MKNYEAGREIISMNWFDKLLENGTLIYVKCWRKTVHPIILANMQYRLVKRMIDNGDLTKAKKIKREEKPWKDPFTKFGKKGGAQ